ncbi:Protein CBG14365 [Caenorhabditis briggsae]|uniref:Uncharacterized protein n=2 Tax=Caenorhabditis briggsae TaxID=6238 RepID=A0AAE8ZPP5_CAEBR|nr:Protein CBG14365 [Caenorhabditis briggsae]ULT82001.1 hypothetical protein L3Y34_011752 [Caenorhabditis briggsae]CAP32922.1 Protein CBG14365 [Caenorhabditis briggsae]
MILFLLFFFIVQLLQYSSAKPTLNELKGKNEFGEWKSWKKCPTFMYAYAVRYEMDQEQKGRVKSIAFLCKPLSWKTHTLPNELARGDPIRGNWKGITFCTEGHFLTGLSFRSDPEKSGNNSEAIDTIDTLKISCGISNDQKNRTDSTEDDYLGLDHWNKGNFCLAGHAICGIRLRRDEVSAKETVINIVKVLCCRLPRVNLFCVPENTFERLAEYDNREGTDTIPIQYEKQTRFIKTTGSNSTVALEEKEAIQNRLPYGVEVIVEKPGNASTVSVTNHGYQMISNIEVQIMVGNVISKEETTTETYNVPAKKGIIIEQLFIKCDNILVGLPRIVIRSMENVKAETIAS